MKKKLIKFQNIIETVLLSCYYQNKLSIAFVTMQLNIFFFISNIKLNYKITKAVENLLKKVNISIKNNFHK